MLSALRRRVGRDSVPVIRGVSSGTNADGDDLTTAEGAQYRTSVMRDFFRASSVNGEMGSLAIDGFFVTAGISYSWIRR